MQNTRKIEHESMLSMICSNINEKITYTTAKITIIKLLKSTRKLKLIQRT